MALEPAEKKGDNIRVMLSGYWEPDGIAIPEIVSRFTADRPIATGDHVATNEWTESARYVRPVKPQTLAPKFRSKRFSGGGGGVTITGRINDDFDN